MSSLLVKTVAWAAGQYAAVAEEAFLLRWPVPVLLWTKPVPAPKGPHAWKTSMLKVPTAQDSANASELRRVSGDTVVLPLEKSPRNPYRERIYVGRAPGNDVVLDDVNVSKSHAFFSLIDDRWTLTDTGSTNGTTADAGELFANKAHPLPEQTTILFGLSCTVYYAQPKVFYRILKAHAAK